MARSRITDFEVLSRLGSGSFGTVFKVKRIVDNNYYVIKNVRIAELSFKEQSEAINEVQILAQMKSPFVVRYFDSFIERDSLHIVMEYCNRGDLQNLLKKAKEKNVSCLKEHVIWNIFIQVIQGLLYLHNKNILHRDLKSANVFLMKDSSKTNYLVKIGDLGVAKLMDTSTALANTIVGTPYYLSPELCADKPYRDKSDCWALGVMIYECCTLRHPFEARNQCALIMKIIDASYKPPSNAHVSDEVINLINWLLQKDPSNRPSIKQLLCEETIQRVMKENQYELPEEFENVRVAHRLNPKKSSQSSDSKKTALDNRTTSNGSAAGSDSKSDVPLLQRQTSDGVSKSPSVPSFKKPMKTTASVPGNRVRGGKRVVSERVLNRHQVKPPQKTSTQQANGNSYDPEDVDNNYEEEEVEESNYSRPLEMDEVQGSEKAIIPDDELLSMSQRIPKIDRETIHEEGIAALSRHSSVREDYSDENTAGMKNLLIKERSFKDYPNLQQGSEYEKDFEEFDPDLQSDSKYVPTEVEARVYQSSKANDMRAVIQAHNKNWGNNKSTKSARVEESEAHDISSTIRNSNSQDNQDDEWNPVWTQQRGMIVDGGTTTNIYGAAAQSIELRGDLYHGGTLADHEGDNYGDDQDYDDDDIDEEEQMQALLELIEDARVRAVNILGETLYAKVYQLCSRHMGETSDNREPDPHAEEEVKLYSDTNSFVKELEATICEHSDKGLEMACEAVFGVKVLLALESKYYTLAKANRRSIRK